MSRCPSAPNCAPARCHCGSSRATAACAPSNWATSKSCAGCTVAVRDRNWGTVPAALSNLRIEAGPDSFRIAYDAAHVQGDIDFRWHGEIAGGADGTITFRLDGAARTTFLRNRIGFCALHPAALAGARCRVTHVDGTVEEARLPDFIVSDQPVQPFADLRALAHEVRPGAWAEVRFSGDVFEMEDQRNWTDASFKTYCTPLRLPYPVEVRAGERVAQAVALVLTDDGRRTTDDGLRSTPRAPRSTLSAPRPTAPVDFELDFTRAAPAAAHRPGRRLARPAADGTGSGATEGAAPGPFARRLPAGGRGLRGPPAAGGGRGSRAGRDARRGRVPVRRGGSGAVAVQPAAGSGQAAGRRVADLPGPGGVPRRLADG